MFIPSRTASAALLAIIGIAGSAAPALAQSSVTLYGIVDQNLSYWRSGSGASVTAQDSYGMLPSRWGLRGKEDLGDGLYASFNLEMGINADDGTLSDSNRAFDRQSWVALGSSTWGEIRLGRQGGPIFKNGGQIDAGGRTRGSMVNNFGAPSRYDNDMAYISPRMQGVAFEVHYALAETGAPARQGIWQVGVDYMNGPWRAGYAGLLARAPKDAQFKDDVRYDNLYGNYDWGRGKLYLALVRSNNSSSGSAGNNAATVLGNTGGLVAGSNPEVRDYHHIWQVSADWRVLDALRLAVTVGEIKDRAKDRINGKRDAVGASLAAYYSLSKRTTLYAVAQHMDNKNDAGFRPAGSARHFRRAEDVNGRSFRGLLMGVAHRF